MAERLSNLAYQQGFSGLGSHHGSSQHHSQHHHPQQIQSHPSLRVSLDIRSPEELAAVNEFLLTLGKEIVDPSRHHQQQHSGQYSHTHSGRTRLGGNTNNLPSPTYFDSLDLSQLGLANMPGIGPISSNNTGSNTSASSIPSPPSAASSIESLYGRGHGHGQGSSPRGGLYPGFDDHPHSHHSRSSSRRSTGSVSNAYLQTIALSPPNSHPPPPLSPVSMTPTSSVSLGSSMGVNMNSMGGRGSFTSRPTPPLSLSSSGSPAGGARTRSPSPSPLIGGHQQVHIPEFSLSPTHGGSGGREWANVTLSPAAAASVANFDFLARNAGSGIGDIGTTNSGSGMVEPVLGPYEYANARTLRTVVPLKSAPGLSSLNSRGDDKEREEKEGQRQHEEEREKKKYVSPPPGPVEPRLRTKIERGMPAKLAPSSSSSVAGRDSNSNRSEADLDSDMEVDEDERVHEFVRGSPERAGSGDDVEEEGSERSEEGKRLYPLLKDGDAEFRLAPLVGSGSGSSGSASGIRHGDGHSPRSYASISAAVPVSSDGKRRLVNYVASSSSSSGSYHDLSLEARAMRRTERRAKSPLSLATSEDEDGEEEDDSEGEESVPRTRMAMAEGMRMRRNEDEMRGGNVRLPSIRALARDLDVDFGSLRSKSKSDSHAKEREISHGISGMYLDSRNRERLRSQERIDEDDGDYRDEVERGNRRGEEFEDEYDERMRHAKLVRELLVAVNRDYRARFGTPPPSSIPLSSSSSSAAPGVAVR